MFGLRLVDRDDRERELPLGLERAQAEDTRGRLLGSGDHVAELLASGRVEYADDVGAVVHRQVGSVVARSLDVRVVRVVVLTPDGEGRDAVLGDERRGDVVLSGERIGRAGDDVGSARLQRPQEVRGLRRDVQAGRDPVPGEGSTALEALADSPQDGHLAFGPLDPANAVRREREVLDVEALRPRRHRATSLPRACRQSGAASSPAVPVREPHDVVELGGRGFEDTSVLDGRDPVHRPRRQTAGRRRARRRSPRAACPRRRSRLGPPVEDVPRLVLDAVVLQAERLSGSDEEDLAAVLRGAGPDELVAPRLLDALDVRGVRDPVTARAIPGARRRAPRPPAAPSGC